MSPSERTRYRVTGLILAPNLLSEETAVAGCCVTAIEPRRAPEPWADTQAQVVPGGVAFWPKAGLAPGSRGRVLSGPRGSTPWMMLPSVTRFTAKHLISTDVEAHSIAGALDEARTRFQRVVTVFALANAFSADSSLGAACVLEAREIGDPSEVSNNGAWSAVQRAAPSFVLPGAPNDPVTREHLASLTRIVAVNQAVAELLDRWYSAEFAGVAARLDVDGPRRAILDFAVVLETVAQLVTSTEEIKSQDYLKLRTRLECALSSGNRATGITGITEAAQEIERLRLTALKARILAAGKALDVGSEALDAADRCWRLRSGGAAHAGRRPVSNSDIQTARLAVRTYIARYLTVQQERIEQAGEQL